MYDNKVLDLRVQNFVAHPDKLRQFLIETEQYKSDMADKILEQIEKRSSVIDKYLVLQDKYITLLDKLEKE